MRFPSLPIFLLFALSTPLPATEEQTEPTLRTLLVEADALNREEVLHIRTARSFEPLHGLSLQRGSNQMPVITGGTLNLYTERTTPEGTMQWVPVHHLPLPAGERSDLLLIFLDRTSAPLLLNDSVSVHPAGSIRMVNTTRHELIGMIGDKRFGLRPGQDHIESMPGSGLTAIRLAVSNEGEWVPIKSITTRARPERRILSLGRFVTGDGEVYFDMTPIQDIPGRANPN